MSEYRQRGIAYLAPGASSVARVECPAHDVGGEGGYHGPMRRDPSSYGPDEHAVEPESGLEMIDGEVMRVLPSEPPHADRQCDVNYVLRGNIAQGYISSTELLTRVDDDNDFATDACIRKDGEDENGDRHLEEISFEVKYTQSEASLKKRARDLMRRGVRRVFAIHVALARPVEGMVEKTKGGRGRLMGGVKAGPVKEWSAARDDWVVLDNDSYIEDRCLLVPIKVRAFIDAFEANNAVARALVEQRNPVIVEVQSKSYDEGKSDGYDEGKSDGYDEGKSDGYDAGACDGLRQGMRALCLALGIELTTERENNLDALDPDELRDLMKLIQEQRCWPE